MAHTNGTTDDLHRIPF